MRRIISAIVLVLFLMPMFFFAGCIMSDAQLKKTDEVLEKVDEGNEVLGGIARGLANLSGMIGDMSEDEDLDDVAGDVNETARDVAVGSALLGVIIGLVRKAVKNKRGTT